MERSSAITPMAPLHRPFENWSARQPDKPAIIHNGASIAYGQLNDWCNRIAQMLSTRGVVAGTRVGLCVNRSPEFVAGVLGILKCGAVCIPMDSECPAERLDHILRDSGAVTVLSAGRPLERFRAEFAGLDIRCIDLEASQRRLSSGHPNPISAFEPSHLAFVLYTSGSTGRPKGVLISHHGMSQYLASLAGAIGIDKEDRYLHTASFAFSSSNRQLLLPLVSGSSIVLASEADINSPIALFQLVHSAKATIIDLIPSRLQSYLRVMEQIGEPERIGLFDNDLRLFLMASEPARYDVVNAWRRLVPGACRFINMYGMTETSGIVSTYELNRDTASKTGAIPIGIPIAGVEFHLLNDAGPPVAAGEPGELYVESSTLAQGYTDLSANNAFSHSMSGRCLFRTGDRVRKRDDGTWELLGRTDEQLKIDGVRIEPGEIEQLLNQHPAVRECAVVGRATPSGNATLAVFYVSHHWPPPDSTALGEFLRRFLPNYMIPAQFLAVAALPRTLSGKIDQSVLRALSATAAPTTPPRTPLEMRIFEIWSTALKRSDFGVYCNFFELGGKSIALHEINARILQEFDVRLHASTIFRHPYIAHLAKHIERSGSSLPGPGPRIKGKVL